MCYSLREALPDTLEAVLEAAQQAADTKSTGDMEHWQLHQDIITENFAALFSRFVEDGNTQVSFSANFCVNACAVVSHACTDEALPLPNAPDTTQPQQPQRSQQCGSYDSCPQHQHQPISFCMSDTH